MVFLNIITRVYLRKVFYAVFFFVSLSLFVLSPSSAVDIKVGVGLENSATFTADVPEDYCLTGSDRWWISAHSQEYKQGKLKMKVSIAEHEASAYDEEVPDLLEGNHYGIGPGFVVGADLSGTVSVYTESESGDCVVLYHSEPVNVTVVPTAEE